MLFGVAMLPLVPFLYLQARYTRFKVGRLPDAEGKTSGVVGSDSEQFRVLLIGESTVAGVGAANHEEALSGQFAKHLNNKAGLTVEWHALGKSGITVSETLEELVPRIPDSGFDLILVALGGNDLFKISSPRHWRKKMTDLIRILKDKNPNAEVFLANIPMIRDFIAMPDPLRYCLSRLAKIQHFNTIRFTAQLEEVYYFEEVDRVDDDFFSDGIHPSANGYDSWSEAMVDSYMNKSAKPWSNE
jgi:lysophospholipase L1-like esterase